MTIPKKQDVRTGEEKLFLCSRGNEILEDCMELISKGGDAGETLQQLLTYLGKVSGCDRTFLFEKSEDDRFLRNTFEWCKEGVRPQQELMRDLPREETRRWLDLLQDDPCWIIEDLESLWQTNPMLYSDLKPLQIRSAVLGRITQGEKIAGFWGCDNPDPEILPVFRYIAVDLCRVIDTQRKRRDLDFQLRDLHLRDQETGFYNLQALYAHSGTMDAGCSSMGVIYLCVENVPLAGSSRPLTALRELRESIERLLDTQRIYRISPTEFLVIYARVDRERVDRRRRSLRMRAAEAGWSVRVGSAWSDRQPIQMDDLIRNAIRWSCLYGSNSETHRKTEENLLHQYLEKNYFDLDFFLKGITHNNDSAYFFFGDMQERIFYISENLRRKFGFSRPLVPELMYAWSERIENQRSRKRYWKELHEIVEKKQDCFNLYHQVVDAGGHREWVHLYGEFQWNEDRSEILFCTGRITMQDQSLATDYETHFSLESQLVQHLTMIRKHRKLCYFIGFSFNHMTRINDMEGRAFGNALIRSTAEELMSRYYDRAAFYKLSGMRFAALVRPEAEQTRQELIQGIRDTIEEKYRNYGVQVPNACTLVLTRYPQEELEPLDFVEYITSCIKLVQQDGSRTYVDGMDIDMDRVRSNANLSMELSRDVLSHMRNFRMVVQPVVETGNSRIRGGEALLRWHNGGRDVSPGIFIPMLERENMMIPVGRWVFEEGVKACRRMLAFYPDFHLSINVSLQQLDDEGLMDFISATIEKYQVSGSHLILEMTESCMDSAQEKLMQFVLFCIRQGITVSLDDFGTGYSSIRVLMQYPTAIIKLDRSLLLEMGKSMDKKNFISSIVFACHQFGKRVCIEGVETLEQDQMVREACCDMIQGFYYYRPMELDDVCELLARQRQLPQEESWEPEIQETSEESTGAPGILGVPHPRPSL